MKLNRRIVIVMVAVLTLFLVMVGYLTYFTVFEAEEYKESSYNARQWKKEEKVLRGTIFDRNGLALAISERTDYGQKRIYHFGEMYAHTIGYSNRKFGRANLEAKYNAYLLKTRGVLQLLAEDAENEEYDEGADITLTLDHGMTKLASKLLRGANGSVVALNPVTGEVYCMYSNPSFNPDEDYMVKNMEKLAADENKPFYPRATQGYYAPGSTFKIVTSASAIESGNGFFITDDKGKTTVGGKDFKNASSKAYGEIGLTEAVKYSSNVYFTEISQKIGANKLKETAQRFLVNQRIPFDIDTKTAILDFDSLDDAHLASVSIGQGDLLVTPLNMALVASAIANNGVIMKPYLVEKADYDNADIIYKAKREVLSEATDAQTASVIGQAMIECVKGGTGTNARVSGIEVAGKTGTAQNETSKDHAWFIGYAPANNPQIAICVMKEYSGSGGGSACAPVARDIIKYALNNGLIVK